MTRMVDQPGDHSPLWTVTCTERAPGVRVLTWPSGQCWFVEWPMAGRRWLHCADVVWAARPVKAHRLFGRLPGCTLVVVRTSGVDALAYSQDGRCRRLRGDLDKAALWVYRGLTST